MPGGQSTIEYRRRPVHDNLRDYQGRVTQRFDITGELKVQREIDRIVEKCPRRRSDQTHCAGRQEGFFATLGSGINALIGVVENAFNDIAKTMSLMAKGDLTKSMRRRLYGCLWQGTAGC